MNCNINTMYIPGSFDHLSAQHAYIFIGGANTPDSQFKPLDLREVEGLLLDYNLSAKRHMIQIARTNVIQNKGHFWDPFLHTARKTNHLKNIMFNAVTLTIGMSILVGAIWLNEKYLSDDKHIKAKNLFRIAFGGSTYLSGQFILDEIPNKYKRLAECGSHRYWKVVEITRVDLPLSRIDELCNKRDENGSIIDPISLESIPENEIQSPSILIIGKYLFRCDSALRSIFTRQIERQNGQIPHPFENRCMTKCEKEEFLRHLSLISGAPIPLIAACWDPEAEELYSFAELYLSDILSEQEKKQLPLELPQFLPQYLERHKPEMLFSFLLNSKIFTDLI